MENVLATYALPHNEEVPVICFDERPCQLLSHIVDPIAPSPGRNARYDYHYKRAGTCVVLMAIEPLTGQRIVKVTEQRRKQEYTEFMELVDKAYPRAKKIKLVQDNFNTHSASSFYASRVPEEAFDLMERFEMIFTPKKASWLNMIEIEFAALSKQCLDRRIGSIEELEEQVKIWTAKRNELGVKIQWEFTKETARKKFERHYQSAQNF
jgi:hypothetical protein